MAQPEDLAQAARLEHYRSRQEAARGFDDDLEFCPSLSAEELAEIRRQVSHLVSQGQGKQTTPPQYKRPIPIIDPNNKTPLHIIPTKSGNSSATNTGQVSMPSTFFSRPGSPFSYGSNYSPTMQPYQSLTTPAKVTKSIPIIDPSSGNIVNMPNGNSNNNTNNNNNGFGGFFSDISVR